MFTLRNAVLGYRRVRVMNVRELIVPSGGMVFVIGPSGVGKSTLLEALGLMSNTFLGELEGGTELSICDEMYDPFLLWSGEPEALDRIRRENLSFIFQSTNLMPNFSIGENIRMAHFGGKDTMAAFEQRLDELLHRMKLPSSMLDKPASDISGGQRQRVAFIRALAKDFHVLLADEPTGNLDLANSETLFTVLREHVMAAGRTALIVTHHLELAEEFGDHILEIHPGNNDLPASLAWRRSTLLA